MIGMLVESMRTVLKRSEYSELKNEQIVKVIEEGYKLLS